MKNKKTLLIVVSSVSGLLLALAGVLLFLEIRGYQEMKGKLKRTQSTLEMLHAEDPFPSDANVVVVKQNAQELVKWHDELLGKLKKAEQASEVKSPSTFITALSDTLAELKTAASSANVTLGEDMAFGFDRYVTTGTLPEPDDVKRLTTQLTMVDTIARLVFASGASSLTAFSRDEFETAQDGETSSRSPAAKPSKKKSSRKVARMSKPPDAQAGLLPEGALCGKFHFSLEVAGTATALRDLLYQLARSDMFIIVTSLEFSREGEEIKAAPSKEALAEVPQNPIDRLVSGGSVETPLNVRVELDVVSVWRQLNRVELDGSLVQVALRQVGRRAGDGDTAGLSALPPSPDQFDEQAAAEF